MRALLAVLFAVVLVPVGPAHGACGTPLTLERLSVDAHEVVLGRCVDVRSTWNDERTLIHTDAVYEVERRIKGQAGPRRVAVRTIGGTVGRISQWAVGAPRFVVGRRDVLFLVRLPAGGPPRVLGLGHGQLPVRQDVRGRDVVRVAAAPGRRATERPLESIVRAVHAVATPRPGADR